MEAAVLPRWCPSCGAEAAGFAPGPRGRPDASCPRCRALERHRFLSVLLDGLAPWLSLATLVVDVAPGPPVSQHLRRLCPRGYLGVDLDPAADGRPVDVRASITALPLADATVDLLVAYHVLEHVPDDGAAMREVRRVLKPGGLALLQVPWAPEDVTDEDPDASVEERVRRFGQADHVRMYGGDFEDRLRAAGLDVARLTPGAWVGEEASRLMHLRPDEATWAVGRGAGDGGPGPLLGGVVPGGLATVLVHGREREVRLRSERDEAAERAAEAERQADVELARLEDEVRRARARVARLEDEVRAERREAARWRRGYERIRGRLPVRVAAAARRVVRRSTGRAAG